MIRTDKLLYTTAEVTQAVAFGLPFLCLFLFPFFMGWMVYTDWQDGKRYEANCLSRFNAGAIVTPKCLDLVMTKAENTFGEVN